MDFYYSDARSWAQTPDFAFDDNIHSPQDMVQYGNYVPYNYENDSPTTPQEIAQYGADNFHNDTNNNPAPQEIAQFRSYVSDENINGVIFRKLGWVPIHYPQPKHDGPNILKTSPKPQSTPYHGHESPSLSAPKYNEVQSLPNILDPHAMCPPDCIAKIRDQVEELKRKDLQRLIDWSRRTEEQSQMQDGTATLSNHVSKYSTDDPTAYYG